MAVPVIAHEQEIATLEVWPRPGANIDERRELLSYVVPAIATALHDALTFTAVSRYRKTLEDKVEQRTAELRRLASDLESTVDALRRAQEARDRIFANVNHEIRTPLSLILLSTSKMRRELAGASAGVQAPLDGIDSAVGRLLWLIDGILLLASRSSSSRDSTTTWRA